MYESFDTGQGLVLTLNPGCQGKKNWTGNPSTQESNGQPGKSLMKIVLTLISV